jgi:hypothetical protein
MVTLKIIIMMMMKTTMHTTFILKNSDEAGGGVDNDGMAAGPASNAQVAVNIVISFVGAGLLGVPAAFFQSRLVLGITLCVISALSIYSMLLLPQVKRA